MKIILTIIVMIFFHIIADYNLQGWLASAKQKKWWEENAPDYMYRHDYITALFMHSFCWSFMIMLPIVFVNYLAVTPLMLIVFGVNVMLHMIIDNMKANLHMINLRQDQVFHILQIVYTALIFVEL